MFIDETTLTTSSIYQNNNVLTASYSLYAASGITGSLLGTSSYSTTASYTLTASYIDEGFF
jgi:hypothetical protein